MNKEKLIILYEWLVENKETLLLTPIKDLFCWETCFVGQFMTHGLPSINKKLVDRLVIQSYFNINYDICAHLFSDSYVRVIPDNDPCYVEKAYNLVLEEIGKNISELDI